MVKLPEVISYAKIRGSYTVVASSFDRFLTNPGYEYNSQTHNWANPTVYPMDNMKPEKTKSWEILDRQTMRIVTTLSSLTWKKIIRT